MLVTVDVMKKMYVLGSHELSTGCLGGAWEGQMAVSLSIIGGLKGLLSAPLPAMCNIKCVAPPQYIERGLAGTLQSGVGARSMEL